MNFRLPFSRHQESLSTASVISNWVLFGFAVLLPWAFIPVLINSLAATKVFLLLATAIALLSLYIVNVFSEQKITITSHRLIKPLMLFGLSAVLTTFLTNPYPVENLLGWGGMYMAGVIVAIVGGTLAGSSLKSAFHQAVVIGGLVTGVTTFAQILGFGPSRILSLILGAMGAGLPHDATFSLAGSTFMAAQVLVLVIAALAARWLRERRLTPVELTSLVVSVVALGLSLFMIFPGKPASPLLLPYSVGWSVAVDSIRSPRAALIGAGFESFGGVYSQLKPLAVNTQAWWNVIFTNSSNTPFTLLVTAGFIGLLSWLYLAFSTIRNLRFSSTALEASALATAAVILHLLFPATVVTFGFLALAWATIIASEGREHDVLEFHLRSNAAFPSALRQLLPSFLGLALFVVLIYPLLQFYASSYLFFKASVALDQNKVVEGYEFQRQAIALNPFLSNYRSAYALTNLAIAGALSNKADASETEKAQITQLIQQSIREARAATLLRADVSSNWENLARVYQTLIGVAEGADQWAVDAYVTAIQTAPTNPDLRIQLGGIFYAGKQYTEAATLFQQAAQLNPNMPNAYYNLANALRELGQTENAIAAYKQTLTLIDPSSEDYIRANQELEALQKQFDEEKANPKKSADATVTPPTATDSAQTNGPSLIQQNLSEPSLGLDGLNDNNPVLPQ